MRKITLIEEEEIVKLYLKENVGYKAIAAQFKVDGRKIRSILIKNGVTISKRKSPRSFRINEDFFEKIDTPEKAYVLGFLWADGNICKNLQTIRFLNHPQDKEVLEKIANLIFQDGKQITFDQKYNRVYLNICSKKMVKDLLDKGCYPKKSLTITFPNEDKVPQELQSHFLRGYFDGDGCIYLKKNSLNVSIAVSKAFFGEFSKILNKLGCSFYIEDIGAIFVVKVIGNRSCLRLLNFIYAGQCHLLLRRKYQKVQESLRAIFEKNKRTYNETIPLFLEAKNIFNVEENPVFFQLKR